MSLNFIGFLSLTMFLGSMTLMAVGNSLLIGLFILSYGAMCGVVSLSASLWYKRRELRLFKTFLFFSYLTLLFFLAGLRFAAASMDSIESIWAHLLFEIIEKLAYASLIYFLPATVNYILGRQWSAVRLVRVFGAVAVYLFSGLLSIFVGTDFLPGILAALSFLFIILFVLLDIATNLPLISDEGIRTALFLLYGITFFFLPGVQVLPLFLPGAEKTLFAASSVYYGILGVCGIVFFFKALSGDGTEEASADSAFSSACDEAGLTSRESEIAELIAKGCTYKEVAAALDISPNTVGNHIAAIYRKTGTRSKVEMVNSLRP